MSTAFHGEAEDAADERPVPFGWMAGEMRVVIAVSGRFAGRCEALNPSRRC